jgi:hypothetical protein
MRFTVLWVAEAEAALAQLWESNVAMRAAITAARL